MPKDLRGREALRRGAELGAFANAPAFDTVEIADLRKLAELLGPTGALDAVTVGRAAEFGGTSRHRLECARRALEALAGKNHPATRAVAAALSGLGHSRRKGTHHRDHRPREAILLSPWWASFRDLPGAATAPLNELRAVDRYLSHCAREGLPGGEMESFLDFVKDKRSSMLLITVRNGLEKLLSAAHPAVTVADQARSRKEAERAARRRPASPAVPKARPLEHSVPCDALPESWKALFERMKTGARVGGKRYRPASIVNMIYAARQLAHEARLAGLPAELSLDTVRAYDAALEARGARPSGLEMIFMSLHALGGLLAVEQGLLDDLKDLAAHHLRESTRQVKLKERKLADLPDLAAVFDKANALLDEAEVTTDRRKKPTLYVDAGALAFLSLVPLRNLDTVLRWGSHVTVGDDDAADRETGGGSEPAPGYFLDLSTSKRDVDLSGPLAPILTPFLDALILRGRDERLLPQLRREAMAARSPVFPKSKGGARRPRSLSERWHARLGVGSGISRTRIHTLLGNLGEHGVRAALALCAQRSPRTQKWYQAEALARRRMLASQEMISGLVDVSDEDADLLASLAECEGLPEAGGAEAAPAAG